MASKLLEERWIPIRQRSRNPKTVWVKKPNSRTSEDPELGEKPPIQKMGQILGKAVSEKVIKVNRQSQLRVGQGKAIIAAFRTSNGLDGRLGKTSILV